MNNLLSGVQRLYLDSNIFIYFIEGNNDLQEKVVRILEHSERNGIQLVTSEITVAECLYGTYRADRIDLSEKYQMIFEESDLIQLIAPTLSVSKMAARVGAQNRLKLIDAIHIASAVNGNCDALVTNDLGIRPHSHLQIIHLSSF